MPGTEYTIRFGRCVLSHSGSTRSAGGVCARAASGANRKKDISNLRLFIIISALLTKLFGVGSVPRAVASVACANGRSLPLAVLIQADSAPKAHDSSALACALNFQADG